MNLSSVIINFDTTKFDVLKNEISKIKECEISLTENEKMIVVITTDSVDKQIEIFKRLTLMSGVNDVFLSYFYDDSDADLNDCFIEDVLNNDKIKSKDIIYNGNVNYKI